MSDATTLPLGQRVLPLAVALLLLGAFFGYRFYAETPTGTIQGVVLISETGKPLSDVDLYLTPGKRAKFSGPTVADANEPERRRHAQSSIDGTFRFSHVPVGHYSLPAASEHHHSVNFELDVREGQTTLVRVPLAPTEESLELGQRQRIWGTQETPLIPVRGYLDPKAGLKRDSLKVRIWKTRLSSLVAQKETADALEKVNRSYYGGTEKDDGPKGILPKALTNAAKLLSEKDVDITHADREGFFSLRLPLKNAGPGLYLFELRHGASVVRGTLMSTDLALVTSRAEGQMVAFVTGLMSGQPVSGATIHVFRNDVASVTKGTDKNGIAELALPRTKKRTDDEEASGDEGGRNVKWLTVATKGEDEAVLSRDDWSSNEGSGQFRVHSYTDRTIYRPGHTVSYKTIVRRSNPAPSATPYSVPSGEPVTIEVKDPNGGRVIRETKTTNRWGTVDGSFDLSAEAPTGVYNLVTTLKNGEKHTSDITVASYRKPEFTVSITPGQKAYVQGDTITTEVKGTYYYGAPVAGAKVHYSLYREPDWSSDYLDTEEAAEDSEYGLNEHRGYYGESVLDGDAVLDESGKLSVTFPTDRKRRDERHNGKRAKHDEDEDVDAENTSDNDALARDQKYTLNVSVTEQGTDRNVDADASVKVTAGAFSLALAPDGYVAEPNKPHTLTLRARDSEGKPVPNVDVTIQSAFERWDAKSKTLKQENLPALHAHTGADGGAIVTVSPKRAGDLRLTATAYDARGRVLHAQSNLWVSGDNGGDLGTQYTDLALLTDKKRYEPGDTARVLINASRTGQTAYLLVESERVYQVVPVTLKQRSTLVRLPLRAEWGPNVTLGAYYVKDKKFASSSVPLIVRLTKKMLQVTVTPDKTKYRPGTSAVYTVRVADGNGHPAAAEVSLSVVDESIYALREDDPQALTKAFYPRRENRVKTDYSFEVTYLGDSDKSEPTIELRRKFLDTAFWNAHVATGTDGTARVTVPLPDNLTTWRATALAVSSETAVGRGVSKIVVNKPLSIRLDTPRVLTETDEGRLLALVSNESGADQTVHVRVTAPGLLKEGTSATQTLSVRSGQIGQAEFSTTAHALGDVKLEAVTWSDASDTQTGKPFTDGITQTIPIRAWGREKYVSLAGVIGGEGTATSDDQAGKTRVFDLDPNSVPSETKLTLRVTPSVRGALLPALEYLIGFPYGCTEQTMSRFLPDLMVDRLAHQLGGTPLLPGKRGAAQQRALPRLVRDGLTRLKALQHEGSGGWGWWSTDKDSAFMTAYVLYGLKEAQQAGYQLPEGMLPKAIKAGKELLPGTDAENRAFLLYALANAGEREAVLPLLHGAMGDAAAQKKVKLVRGELESDSLAYLVLAARALNESPGAAWEDLQKRATRDGRVLYWKAPKWHWNTSDRMTTALALRAFLVVAPQDGRVSAILRYLMESRTGDHWYDTRDTSWIVIAFCDYLQTHPQDAAAPSGKVGLALNGTSLGDWDLASFANAGDEDASEIVVHVPASAVQKGHNTLQFTGGSMGTLYWNGELTQVVKSVGDSGLPTLADADGLSVKREYLSVPPPRSGIHLTAQTPTPATRFHPGDDVQVRLTITAPRDISYVLIEDRFPSACEVTARGTAEEVVEDGDRWNNWYNNVDVRDDRIAVFATKLPKGVSTFTYHLRAQTPGAVRALPGVAQAMYAPTLRAETADTRIEVVK